MGCEKDFLVELNFESASATSRDKRCCRGMGGHATRQLALHFKLHICKFLTSEIVSGLAVCLHAMHTALPSWSCTHVPPMKGFRSGSTFSLSTCTPLGTNLKLFDQLCLNRMYLHVTQFALSLHPTCTPPGREHLFGGFRICIRAEDLY